MPLIEVTGAKEVAAGLTKLMPAIEAAAKEEAQKQADLIAQDAASNHRFQSRTGTLASSVTKMDTPSGAQVFLDSAIAKYAEPIHDGFGSWAADPFLEQAASRREEETYRAIEEAIDDVIVRSGFAD